MGDLCKYGNILILRSTRVGTNGALVSYIAPVVVLFRFEGVMELVICQMLDDALSLFFD